MITSFNPQPHALPLAAAELVLVRPQIKPTNRNMKTKALQPHYRPSHYINSFPGRMRSLPRFRRQAGRRRRTDLAQKRVCRRSRASGHVEGRNFGHRPDSASEARDGARPVRRRVANIASKLAPALWFTSLAQPERTSEDIVYELDASGLIAAGLDPARIKQIPELGQ